MFLRLTFLRCWPAVQVIVTSMVHNNTAGCSRCGSDVKKCLYACTTQFQDKSGRWLSWFWSFVQTACLRDRLQVDHDIQRVERNLTTVAVLDLAQGRSFQHVFLSSLIKDRAFEVVKQTSRQNGLSSYPSPHKPDHYMRN